MAAPQYQNPGIQVIQSYHNDISPALRDLPLAGEDRDEREMRQANLNPQLPLPLHADIPDPVIDHGVLGLLLPDVMPTTILSFDGIPFPGVGCFCVPPDADGAVGLTQYVQVVNEAYQVFNKTTGASVLGPSTLTAIWSGFGGVCQNNGIGDPVVLYDHIANRWLISKFAGMSVPTDACVALSTTSDATGPWNRYAYHLGSNFFTDPKLSIWPDGYYMSVNVFNAAGTPFLGPQAFAFDRAKMLGGLPATAITPGVTGGPNESPFLPSDLDGSILPPSGAPNSFVEFPGAGIFKLWHFHVDFVTPANSTFTLFASPPAAAFTLLCPTTQSCVPQLGTAAALDGVGNRLMFRLAYRNFGSPSTPDESIVGNFSVSSGGVAGLRWFELKNVTSGPVTVAQESTYQPDATWRWLGSAAMDHAGNFALGFSASSAAIHPQIRYAGRLATDPPNTLAQGEAHLFDGSGSSGSGGWDHYSALTVDPVDDCTFWYTNEYYDTTNWRTRIGNFKFAQCNGSATPTPTPTPTPGTPSPTPTPPPPTPTTTPGLCSYVFLNESFDGVTAPALPPGWVSSFTPGPANCTPAGTCALGTNWTTSTIDPHSPPNCAFHDAPSCVTDSSLYSPIFFNADSGAFLFVSHSYDLESGLDGAVLEISINGGPFTDFLAAGGSFFGNTGYNGTISLGTQSPIAGRAAWTGNSGGYTGINAYMPSAAAHQSVVLRFRLVTDCSGASAGWRVDDIQVVLLVPCNTPTIPPTVTPTPSPISPSPTATATVPPSPTPPTQALNLSTRLRVQTGDNAGIGGFIITGNAPKYLLFRGLGPSLTALGIPGALANPTLDLRRPDGTSILANDNWRDAQETEIQATGIPPTDNLEAAIVQTLDPGSYTVILRGMGMTTGVGLLEIYDLDQGVGSKLANISTRAFVETGASIVIAGFIVGGTSGSDQIVVRGIGPSLAALGLSNTLPDPTLELRDGNGALLRANNNWEDDPAQAAELTDAGLALSNQLESGIAMTLPPGAYTALLAGFNNGSGAGLVEVYDLGAP